LNDPVPALERLERDYIAQHYELAPGQKRVPASLVSQQFRDNLQRQADELTGRINAFEQIFDKYHRDMVEPGEYLYGIDLSKLDWRTRLLVRGGNRQTIAALGGTWAEETDMPLQDALQDEEGL
jgi:hypothetical protein